MGSSPRRGGAPGRVALVAVAALLLPGCGAMPRAPSSSPTDSPLLSCRIEGPATCSLGESPALRVVLVNLSVKETVLVGSLDGSDSGMRYPHCLFEITGPPGVGPVPDAPRCGNANFLRAEDFVVVPPGGAFRPFGGPGEHGFFPSSRLLPRNFPVPGVYRLRFVYDTRCDDIRRWDGNFAVAGYEPSSSIRTLWSRVPRLRVESPEFLITVVE